jgi:hypothetical protein
MEMKININNSKMMMDIGIIDKLENTDNWKTNE